MILERILAMSAVERLAVNLRRFLEGKKQSSIAWETSLMDPKGKGVVQQVISDISTGQYPRVRLEMVEWLAAALNVDVTDLLADTSTIPSEPDARVRALQRRIQEIAETDQDLFLAVETLVKKVQPR